MGYYFYIDPASQNKLSRHPVIPAKQLLFSLISSTVLSSTPAVPFQSATARRYVPDRKYSKNIYALFYFSSRCREATAAKLQSSSTGNHCGTYDKHQTAAVIISNKSTRMSIPISMKNLPQSPKAEFRKKTRQSAPYPIDSFFLSSFV